MESGIAAARGTAGATATDGGWALADPVPALASHPVPAMTAHAIARRGNVRIQKVIVVGMYRARRVGHDSSVMVSFRGRSDEDERDKSDPVCAAYS